MPYSPVTVNGSEPVVLPAPETPITRLVSPESPSVSLVSTLPVTAAVPSVISAVSATAVGASLAAVTSKVIVFAVGSVSTPPLAVPPPSLTWKVKLATPEPFWSAGGV